jgi:hypothetical protein
MHITAITVVFYSQAASPACTELETIVLDWLGESHPVNRTHHQYVLSLPPHCQLRLLSFRIFRSV